MIKGWLYRVIMKIAHRYNWHYAPPIYPENDVQLWCQWCGFRQTIKRGGHEKADDQAKISSLRESQKQEAGDRR